MGTEGLALSVGIKLRVLEASTRRGAESNGRRALHQIVALQRRSHCEDQIGRKHPMLLKSAHRPVPQPSRRSKTVAGRPATAQMETLAQHQRLQGLVRQDHHGIGHEDAVARTLSSPIASKTTTILSPTYSGRRQRRPAPAPCAGLQSRQFLAHAGDARANQRLVSDEPEGEADQDRCEGGLPRTLCCLPDGGGRHPTADVPRDFAADCGTTAAATTNASVKARDCHAFTEQSTGGVRPNASENSQISHSTTVLATRGCR